MLVGGLSNPLASLDGTISKDGHITAISDSIHHAEQSASDSDMDSVIKKTSFERKDRNMIHRVSKEWNNKITAEMTKDAQATD